MQTRIQEIVASCSNCKTLETLEFRGNKLEETSRFRQAGDLGVWHSCFNGKEGWCRFFQYRMGWGKV